nr:MAG TPA: hypothetical protein [Caudoviricetes sp.]DAU00949.1 MAG TPA: hypothetical protein [Caudoviricetes sp.]
MQNNLHESNQEWFSLSNGGLRLMREYVNIAERCMERKSDCKKISSKKEA